MLLSHFVSVILLIVLIAVPVCVLAGWAAYVFFNRHRNVSELMSSLDEAIVTIDAKGSITAFNARFKSWFGDKVGYGVPFKDVLHDKQMQKGLSEQDAVLLLDLPGREEAVRVVIDGYAQNVRCIALSGKRHGYVMMDRSSIERMTHTVRRVETERTALLDLVPVGLAIATSSGEVRYANQHAAAYLGYAGARDVIGRSGLEFCQSDTQRETLQQRLRSDGYIENAEVELRARDGGTLWAQVSARAIELDHGRHIFISVSNITDNKQTERSLRDSEQKIRDLLDTAPCAIFMVDMRDRSLLFFNRHADSLFGLQTEPAGAGANFMTVEDVSELMASLRRDGTAADREVQCRTAQGKVFWYHVSATRAEYDGREAMFCALLDIDARLQAEFHLRVARAEAEEANRELRSLNLELEQLASTDRLTGVFNRRYFEEVAQREMSRARRYGMPLSLIIIDLDHFKNINDEFGHAAGDRVLQTFTQLARGNLRSSDVLARWGGEEFVVLAPSTTLDEALLLANKLRELLEHHEAPDVHPITLSAGVTILTTRDSFDAFVRRADKALYAAKSAGRNRVAAAPRELAA